MTIPSNGSSEDATEAGMLASEILFLMIAANQQFISFDVLNLFSNHNALSEQSVSSTDPTLVHPTIRFCLSAPLPLISPKSLDHCCTKIDLLAHLSLAPRSLMIDLVDAKGQTEWTQNARL